MYHPVLYLELARELSRERAQQVPSAARSTPRRRPILRLTARTKQRPRSQAHWRESGRSWRWTPLNREPLPPAKTSATHPSK